MKRRSRSILLAGVIAGLLVVAGTVSVTAGGRTAGPTAPAVDKLLYQEVKTCLESAIRRENAAIKTKSSKIRNKNIRAALTKLNCAQEALRPRRGEIENGLKIRDLLNEASTYDRRALGKNRKRAMQELSAAGFRKRSAFFFLAPNVSPPEVDLGCEFDTADAGPDDELATRCQNPGGGQGPDRTAAAEVNEVELSARKPITNFSDWTVVGNNLFRTGQCTRLAESLINCRIDPPMPVGGVFVVRLAGLPAGTSVVMEVVSGNRAQHGTLITR